MQTLEEMRAKHAKELARLEAKHALAASAPFPPKMAQETLGGLTPWLTYEAESFRAALELFEKFECLPYFHFKEKRGGFTRYQPRECAEESKWDETAGTFIAWIEVDQGRGYGPSASLKFFIRLADNRPARVSIGLHGAYGRLSFGAFSARLHESRDGRGRITSRDWTANNLLNAMCDKVTKWGGGGESARYSYNISADWEDSPDRTHAIGQLQNIADSVEPRKAEESE